MGEVVVTNGGSRARTTQAKQGEQKQQGEALGGDGLCFRTYVKASAQSSLPFFEEKKDEETRGGTNQTPSTTALSGPTQRKKHGLRQSEFPSSRRAFGGGPRGFGHLLEPTPGGASIHDTGSAAAYGAVCGRRLLPRRFQRLSEQRNVSE